jgi:acyl-CoA synthetase (AMP-forming)/AMP-acid ligase II
VRVRPLLSGGYWKLPEETAKTYRNGWLRTGDMAREDEDGYWFIVDRVKDVIVTGGFNVYPREVEDVVAEHPSVAQVCVVGARMRSGARPSPPWWCCDRTPMPPRLAWPP